MSYINTSQAAMILGVSKKTLLRWDEAGKFSPASREKLSKGRLYKEKDVLSLKMLQENEVQYRDTIKLIREVQNALNPYSNRDLSKKEEELLNKEAILRRRYIKIIKEFDSFSPAVKQIHKQFYMSK